MKRRNFLQQSLAAAAIGVLNPEPSASEPYGRSFEVHKWERDASNPILPPGGGWFDTSRCMNPFVIKKDGLYWLFYSGGDQKGNQRICLATASVQNLHQWERKGPLFDIGPKGAFDDAWCVLPCIHHINGKWHLYYTGKWVEGKGLQAFKGIGLATSPDLIHWERASDHPVLMGDGFPEWPENKGIAGGGRIIEIPQEDGRTLYRMFYTLATGSPSKDLLIDQAKQSVIAHSYDGINWYDKRIIMRPRLEATYENAATIALNIWKTKKRWRAIYAGIGTKFGAYSICEAVSDDGLNWERGKPGENLSLPPGEKAWENKMTEYPHVVHEGKNLRLFYCGNGYGTTGIGMATARALD